MKSWLEKGWTCDMVLPDFPVEPFSWYCLLCMSSAQANGPGPVLFRIRYSTYLGLEQGKDNGGLCAPQLQNASCPTLASCPLYYAAVAKPLMSPSIEQKSCWSGSGALSSAVPLSNSA